MQKAFDPVAFESRLYHDWMQKGCFKAQDESAKPAFAIAMPPPNITGVLHNGHALFVTVEDILTRWKRMSGYNTLWLPGTDHAGIATQMVVERDLAKAGIKRQTLGRTEFLKRVWEWKEKSGNAIVEQMHKLGASPDWDRLQFTMDPHLSKVVRNVFVTLFQQGLIYRGSRIINWCPRCQTALSDLEVKPVDRKGHFYHLKYEVVSLSGTDNKTSESLIIATTRPETLLGDTAVAVHPEDARYQSLIGKKVKVPLIGREIPVIADNYVDREFGSGALKITPGHDFNDYEIGKRHSLEMINVFTKDGKVNQAGQQYAGLAINEAREKIVADLLSAELLIRTEDHSHSVGVCDRCERTAEPMMSEQWFMNVKPLAEKAIQAVRLGETMTLAEVDQRDDAIKIVPETWTSTYYNWMENIRDWCISRQLWWGHQIPAFYCSNGHTTVSASDITKCPECQMPVKQDEDVLDTWFSSALWPFSTLGWPEKTPAYKTFYPTQVMETGFDILFFWVARMIMMGLHFNEGKVPFKRVYLHAMVRDEKGQKMSKTKGNVLDPLDLIRDHGADALRFTLAIMAGQGRDVKLSIDRIEGYQAFCNKLWNASRFVLMQIGGLPKETLDRTSEDAQDTTATADPTDFKQLTQGKTLQEWVQSNRNHLHPLNQWILCQLESTVEQVVRGLEEFRLNESAQSIYDFVWGQYCDWYIEFSKVLSLDPKYQDETKICLLFVLEQILKLAHPFIPFITEEIYQHLPSRPGVKKGDPLMLADFPKLSKTLPNEALETITLWKSSIDSLRAFRGENNITPKARPKITYEILNESHKKAFIAGVPFIRVLAKLESLNLATEQTNQDQTISQILTPSVKFYVPLKGLVDVEGELRRVEKEKQGTMADINFVEAKLAKPTFIEKAPAELVAKERDKLVALHNKIRELELALERLAKLK